MGTQAPDTAMDEGRGPLLQKSREIFLSPTTPGIVLILCTVLALIAANSGFADRYHAIFNSTLTIGFEGFGLSKPLHLWINDGLMAIFFFAIGLEIKRELLIGQLSSIKRSALPIIAALGGMVVPAGIFMAFTMGGPGAHGWAIPMATDIAFALGVLSLLGNRVPTTLKIFLLALAIVDDLGAVLVIAIFYTDTIAFGSLIVAMLGWLLAIALNVFRVRRPLWYALTGIVVWVAMLKSGVHATIAGVMMGFAIPVRTLYDGQTWLSTLEESIARYRTMLTLDTPDSDEELGMRQDAVHEIEDATEKAQSPLIRLEHGLQPWVSYLIMPVFALTNAGVPISAGSITTALGSSVTWGIFLGLFIGKQAGVFLFSWLAVKLGIASRPEDIRWRQFYGVAILAGIGFTMSLFVTELSYGGDREMLDISKLSIIAASLLSGIVGYVWLRVANREGATASISGTR